MDTTILGVTNGKHRDTKTNRTTLNQNYPCDKCGEPAMVANRTTLNPNYPCDKCGEPAMVVEGGWLRCPRCWLAEKGKQIKPLDHAGYYP